MDSRSRVFRFDDQIQFAALSGDYNPIHVDPVAARRLLFGEVVVHGIHVLLWMLDRWLADQPAVRVKSVKADFRLPVRTGEVIAFSRFASGINKARLEVSSVTQKLATAEVEWRNFEADDVAVGSEAPPIERCDDVSGAQISQAAGTLPLTFQSNLATQLFPHFATKIPPSQLAALLACTRIVGMKAPGLHSVLSGIELKDSTEKIPSLSYLVTEFDDRYSRATLKLDGAGLSGSVIAWLRPAPMNQRDYIDIAQDVKNGEFAGTKALVIGGSRGVGEVAVKQLAAGGAEVAFSYHLGESDAKRVVADVTAGGGTAHSFQHKVGGDGAALLNASERLKPTLLCYFSTPRVAGAPRGKFNSQLFHELCSFYIDGFVDVLLAVMPWGELRAVLHPSSVFVADTPFGLSEYAASKAALENLVRSLQNGLPKVHFSSPQWPRMTTDLTASIIASERNDPGPVVLAALRDVILPKAK